MYENIKQLLIECIAEFLDDKDVQFEETTQQIGDPVCRKDSELHLRMADAAMLEYKDTVVKL